MDASRLRFPLGGCLTLAVSVLGILRPCAAAELELNPVGSYATGLFGKSAAEIPAHCPSTQRVFVVNAESGRVDVLSLSDQGQLKPLGEIDPTTDLAGPMKAVNSVAISRGRVAVAVESDPNTDPGAVAFYDTRTLRFLGSVPTGALPDMVAFSSDGRWVLVANEGEPNVDYSVDPEGTVTVIDLADGIDQAVVRTVDFRDWNAGGSRAHELPRLTAAGLRVSGRVTLSLEPYTSRPATFAEDVEPEWIEISQDSATAFVCLQENNAIAEIDIPTAKAKRLIPLGFKDHGRVGNELDVSDRDGGIRIQSWPGLLGVFQPDTIRLYSTNGRSYLVTANEGDSRVRPYADGLIDGVPEGAVYTDEVTLKHWPLAGSVFEDSSGDGDLGRLRMVRDLVDAHLDQQGRPTKLFAFGGRSFSIFDVETGEIVFDSGSDFERITAERFRENFNASNDSVAFDNRSRSKGPEPEGIAVGELDGKTYAFIGLERIGGIMVYEITDPHHARFVAYVNNRNFSVSPRRADGSANPDAGDSGIEGLIFIPPHQSPSGKPLLVVGNETSGTTTVWALSSTGVAKP